MEIKEFCKKINAVPMSVIEDIKAELKERLWKDDFERVCETIDKHISGEQERSE